MKVTNGSVAADKHVWPPGFRFHPTDEELVLYYLKRKICRRRLKLDIIGEIDVYKWDPEDLPGQSQLKTGDRQWFFFSPRDRKYPNGARSNRATHHGYWKATGKDRNITCNSRTVGVKKTLVFYKGRAPSGERTDWVMHEYTLDEEELKRCQTVGDYYALYKVYKKSGPGPKNGEQYGAPFKEEEWVDEEFAEVNELFINQENPAKQLNEVASVDNSRDSDHQSPLIDIDEILNRIMEEPELDQRPTADYALPPQVFDEAESHVIVVDPSIKEAVFSERSILLQPSRQQCGVEASFDFTQTATSNFQLYEAPEVTSAPNIYEQNRHISEDDFLEIDDLLGPEPTPSVAEKPSENLQFDELDGLSELDLYHDAAMFLRDMGPVDQGTVSHPYLNNLDNGVVNKLDYQLPSNLDYADPMCGQLWTHDQETHEFTLGQSNLEAASLQTPGVENVGNFTNVPSEAPSNQSGRQNDGEHNRFTSALWAFVESIPTTPASASESALVNRAFERMSSFSRVRMNARNTSITADNGSSTIGRASRNKGFFIFSVLGALFAILWVLMKGTTVSVLGRYISL